MKDKLIWLYESHGRGRQTNCDNIIVYKETAQRSDSHFCGVRETMQSSFARDVQ